VSQTAYRNDTTNDVAQNFSIGYDPAPGSGCSFYSPPAGYQCGTHTTFGTSGFPQWPAGLSQKLPNAPYAPAASRAVVHGFRANHWFTRQHQVASSSFNATSGATTLVFDYGRGGFQGAWGTTSDEEFFVENVFEELDAPAEWFHDAAANELFVVWNATGAPPSTGWYATQHMVLINATGSQGTPVRNISLVGLGVRDAAASFFEPRGLPSSGDWSLQRTAAVFFEGAESPLVAGCSFERNDGIVLFLSGYVRGANVSYNSFAWTGETVIALWGYGDGGPVPGMGPDLTAGNQPRGTLIAYNTAREIGVIQKQASFVFSAVAGLSTIVGNWAYNGPRAAINHNDGSLGGSLIDSNIMFNVSGRGGRAARRAGGSCPGAGGACRRCADSVPRSRGHVAPAPALPPSFRVPINPWVRPLSPYAPPARACPRSSAAKRATMASSIPGIGCHILMTCSPAARRARASSST
jgi:hypothetical protein